MNTLGNIELEKNYRIACHKMLAALDTRRAINASNAAVAAAHQDIIGEGAPLLKSWGTTDELDRYRRKVEMVMEKLDKRDQLRTTDTFRDALVTLNTLGEQLSYPGTAEPTPAKPEPILAVEPKRARKASFQDLRTILEANGYDSDADASDVSLLERELAGLQSELASFQAAS